MILIACNNVGNSVDKNVDNQSDLNNQESTQINDNGSSDENSEERNEDVSPKDTISEEISIELDETPSQTVYEQANYDLLLIDDLNQVKSDTPIQRSNPRSVEYLLENFHYS